MNRVLTAVFALACLHLGWKYVHGSGPSDGDEPTANDLAALAATVKAGEVVMYSSTGCPYCADAKAWLKQYGFAFAECNVSESPRCERELMGYGGDGTPYLVVRGRHMKDGFDSDEFVSLLKR